MMMCGIVPVVELYEIRGSWQAISETIKSALLIIYDTYMAEWYRSFYEVVGKL